MPGGPWEDFQPNRAPAQEDGPWSDFAKPEEPKSTALQAGVSHALDSALLGYLPHLSAGAAELGELISGKDDSTYIQRRDAKIKELEEMKREHPIAAGAGMVAGIVGPVLATGGASLFAKGAAKGGISAAARLSQAAKTGAALGAAQNPGDTIGDVDPLQLEARTKNAVVGGALGAGGQGLFEVGGAAAGAVGKWASDKAARKATRALGRPTPTQAAQMRKSGQDVELGRTLLDEGAVPWLGTHGRIAKRVEAMKEKAGEEIGDLLENAGDAKLVDGARAGVKMLDDAEVSRIRNAPGMKPFAKQIDEVAEDLARAGDMSLKEAHQLRRDIDRSIKFQKPAQDRLGTQLALTKSRNVMNESMNEALNGLPGASKDALLAKNKRYSRLARAEELSERGLAQDQANRAVSLTDTIAAAPAMATGNGALGLALGAANKFGRTFGNSIQARTYDAAAKRLIQVPKLAKLAEDNPKAFSSLVERLSNTATGGAPVVRVAEDGERSVATDQPKHGAVIDGFVFLGGDASNPKRWARKAGAKSTGRDPWTKYQSSKGGK